MYFTSPIKKISLLSNEEFNSFVKKEIDFWIDLLSDLFRINNFSARSKELFDFLVEIKESFNKFPEEHGNNFHKLEFLYNEFNLILSSEFKKIFSVQYSENLAPSRGGVYFFIEALISKEVLSITDYNMLPYYNLAITIRNQVDELWVKEVDERTLDIRNENISHVHTLKNAYEKIKSDLNLIQSDLQDKKELIDKSSREILDKYKSDVEAIRFAFETEIKLRSAVRYWEQKKTQHLRNAENLVGMLYIAVPVAIIFSVTVLFMVFVFFDAIGNTKIDKNFKYVLSAFIITLVFWGTRLLVKMWLSNVHLANDADERVVLVKTYLALQKDNVMPHDEDKKVVINSIFRQATDGVVRDDGMPNPVIELLTKNK